MKDNFKHYQVLFLRHYFVIPNLCSVATLRVKSKFTEMADTVFDVARYIVFTAVLAERSYLFFSIYKQGSKHLSDALKRLEQVQDLPHSRQF